MNYLSSRVYAGMKVVARFIRFLNNLVLKVIGFPEAFLDPFEFKRSGRLIAFTRLIFV